MGINKRDFLKISGATLVAAGTMPRMVLAGHADAARGAAKPGQKRWAMVIDLSKCPPDCDDCVKACHKAHQVPQIPEKNHEIKWIWPEKFENAFALSHEEYRYVPTQYAGRPTLILCNHCDNPPCVQVCPTKATFKRESDGIVMMDYHRCIGCRYCMAACPYGSRSFNYVDPRLHLDMENLDNSFPTRMKGVVEKCNFCAERLAEQIAQGMKPLPYCVEACTKGAMYFGDINEPNSEVLKLIQSRFTVRRKPELGTLPMVYYIL